MELANLADFVRRAAAADPDRAALHYAPAGGAGRTITWRELDVGVDAVARGLTALDLPGGGHPARVAVALPNVPEFASVLFGVLRAGLVAVPVNPGYTGREVSHVLSDSEARVLIATGEVVTAAGGAAPVHTFPVAGPDDLAPLTGGVPAGTGPTGPAGAAPVPGDAGAGPAGERLAMLLYTSGTSGAPKGAMLPHRALIANHVQLAELRIAGPDDTVLLALPLFHAYGLNIGLGTVAYHGATGVLVDDFSPRATLELIERHRVTVLIGVPDMFAAWAATGEDAGRALRSVRVAVSGAAPLPRQVAERFAAVTGIEVQVGYGLTETAPVLTSTLAGPAAKPGSIGRPVPGVELRLVGDVVADDEEEDELSVELGTPGTDPGEIEVRGANVFTGYWPDGAGGPDRDGWWATGDVAYADADGDLFLVDRIGELILVSGFNVYPHEVELVLAAHPAVAEAAVIGVPHELTGQTVQAFVVPAAGAAPTEAELAAHCAANLARFKCPSSIVFIAELPHSPTGKVRKTLLLATTVSDRGDQDG